MEYDLDTAKQEFQRCQDAYDIQYQECKEDWDFLHGEDQWDQKDLNKRRKQGRPALILNLLPPYAKQIVNDIRQTRLAIRYSPVDNKGDIDTAETLAGITRNIERQSNAQSAYITAAKNAVGS